MTQQKGNMWLNRTHLHVLLSISGSLLLSCNYKINETTIPASISFAVHSSLEIKIMVIIISVHVVYVLSYRWECKMIALIAVTQTKLVHDFCPVAGQN